MLLSQLNFSIESAKNQHFMSCCIPHFFFFFFYIWVFFHEHSRFTGQRNKHHNKQKYTLQQALYYDWSFSRFGTYFDGRPKILTYHQISSNAVLLTNCPMKVTVSQTVSLADLRILDMNTSNWFWQQPYTVMLWEFFILYLSLLKVIPNSLSI